jgi:hypothetical protein
MSGSEFDDLFEDADDELFEVFGNKGGVSAKHSSWWR